MASRCTQEVRSAGYYFGVRKCGEELSSYICKEREAIPKNAIIKKFAKVNASKARLYAQMELDNKRLKNVEIENDNADDQYKYTFIRIGSIVWYIDTDGTHLGIVLKIIGNKCLMVFCTKNPYWNTKSRQATVEEMKFLGFSTMDHMRSYFAPVVRDLRGIRCRGFEFPRHRVDVMFKEFFSLNEQRMVQLQL